MGSATLVLGRKTEVKDQRRNETIYAYSAFCSPRSEKDPYDNQVEYKYDLNGNPVIQKDKNGGITTILYDACNRVIERRLPLSKEAAAPSFMPEKNISTTKQAI